MYSIFRTHKVVQKWNASLEYKDNDYERFTCMTIDNQYAIMTGTSYGKLILWDRRKNDFIQVCINFIFHACYILFVKYFIITVFLINFQIYDKNDVGYVNCLHFDSSHMYVAADYGIYEFDFTKLQ